MGKFTNFVFNGYVLYFTTKDLKEPFHAHVSTKNLGERGSAKLFIRSDGSTVIAHKGILQDRVLAQIKEYIKANYKKMFKKWLDAGGINSFYRD